MSTIFSVVRRSGCASGLWLLTFVVSSAWTQEQLGTEKNIRKAWEKTQARRTELIAGAAPVAADKEVAEASAQYYLYRITWKEGIDTNKHFERVQSDFASAVDEMIRKKAQPVYLQMFGAALVNSLKAALAVDASGNFLQSAPIVINTCMMIPNLGKLKQDNVSDYLIGLVKEPKTKEVVRLYAFKALKETMPVHVQTEDDDIVSKAVQGRIKMEIRIVDALVKYLEQPIKVSGMTTEEVAVVHFFRREALTALSEAGAPAVVAIKKPAVKVEGPVAPTLIKMLADKDALQPPPLLQEKIEAALGLCRMKYPAMPDYQPDLAIYLVGQTLVEYMNEYSTDFAEFAVKGATRKLPRVAWKTESRRFESALKELSDNAKEPGARAKAEQLKALATPLLATMYRDNKERAYNPLDNTKVAELTRASSLLRPKTGTIFKSVSTFDLPLKHASP